jgi:hypothetical protein
MSVVMDAIAAALDAEVGLNVYGYTPSQVIPPFAFVQQPDTITYDATMARGYDAFTLEVVVGVGAATAVDARALLGAYAAGDGLKPVIEGSLMPDQAIRVTQATFGTYTMTGAEYPVVVFTVSVTA